MSNTLLDMLRDEATQNCRLCGKPYSPLLDLGPQNRWLQWRDQAIRAFLPGVCGKCRGTCRGAINTSRHLSHDYRGHYEAPYTDEEVNAALVRAVLRQARKKKQSATQ